MPMRMNDKNRVKGKVTIQNVLIIKKFCLVPYPFSLLSYPITYCPNKLNVPL